MTPRRRRPSRAPARVRRSASRGSSGTWSRVKRTNGGGEVSAERAGGGRRRAAPRVPGREGRGSRAVSRVRRDDVRRRRRAAAAAAVRDALRGRTHAVVPPSRGALRPRHATHGHDAGRAGSLFAKEASTARNAASHADSRGAAGRGGDARDERVEHLALGVRRGVGVDVAVEHGGSTPRGRRPPRERSRGRGGGIADAPPPVGARPDTSGAATNASSPLSAAICTAYELAPGTSPPPRRENPPTTAAIARPCAEATTSTAATRATATARRAGRVWRALAVVPRTRPPAKST